MMCLGGLPSAVTPLWQVAQPLVTPAWMVLALLAGELGAIGASGDIPAGLIAFAVSALGLAVVVVGTVDATVGVVAAG